MAEKVAKVGVRKESGYLYFVDRQGDVSRAKMARGRRGGAKAKPQKVAKVGVKKASGYLYFIDKHGDVSRAKMARGCCCSGFYKGSIFPGEYYYYRQSRCEGYSCFDCGK